MKTNTSVTLGLTSAIVQLWLRHRVHTSPAAQRYLKSLDLSAGKIPFREANKAWKHYDQVIVNRKAAVLRYAVDVLNSHSRDGQVVLLAAGWDALSVELASRFPKVRLFEVDSDNMEAKSALLKKVCPAQAKRIAAVKADLTKPQDVKRRLKAAGWKENAPTLVLFEGITYYLLEEQLVALVRGLSNPKRVTSYIIEYLVPLARVSSERRKIPQTSFGGLKRVCPLKHITQYTVPKLQHLLPEADFVDATDLHAMERLRTRKNVFFPKPQDGWIEVALFVV